ncbi:MAG: insulinase family protein [Clostridia bacterium]|nr:insulinase family protein [Clostridia bacterium]
MVYLKEYDNGLKLVVKKMDGVMSVSVGIWVGAGSRLETDKNNGISHFLEHMTFKGTENLTAFQISEAFDEIGSQPNAFTSKENTCYYVKSTIPALERSFELLSDMFLNSTYKVEEIEREKGVVIEEINMCADTPEDVCFDNLSLAFFGDEGLGKTILGPAENVKSFDKSYILDYKNDYYNADNVVVCFAGNVDGETAEKLVEKYFKPYISTKKSKLWQPAKSVNLGKVIKKNKDIEQNHLAIAFNGIKYNGEFFDETSLLNTILGSGMSSRLFQKVREELGLCYTVYSYPSAYRDVGSLAIYAGLNPNQTKQAYDAIFSVLYGLKKSGITDKEFEKGKAQVLSSFAFGQESTASQMMIYGKYLLFEGKVFDNDQKIKNIENLKKQTVDELIKRLDFEKYSISLIGKTAEEIEF